MHRGREEKRLDALQTVGLAVAKIELFPPKGDGMRSNP